MVGKNILLCFVESANFSSVHLKQFDKLLVAKCDLYTINGILFMLIEIPKNIFFLNLFFLLVYILLVKHM